MAEKKRMRTTKSKDSLAKAFIQLVESTPYEDIKINNVCEVAKVSRVTFYNNFQSVDEFLLYCFKEHLFKSIEGIDAEKLTAEEAFAKYLDVLVTDFKQKRDFWNSVKGVNLYSSIYYCMRLWLIQTLTKYLQKYEKELAEGMSFDYFCFLLAFSIVGAFSYFLNKGKLDEKKFMNHLLQFTFVPYFAHE